MVAMPALSSKSTLEQVISKLNQVMGILGGVPSGGIGSAALAANAATRLWSTSQSADLDTTSSSYVDVPGVSITLTSVGGILEIKWVGPGHVSAGGVGLLTVSLDGADQNVQCTVSNTNAHQQQSLLYAWTVAAGSHTVKLRARASAGTLHIDASQSISGMTVVEYRR